VNTGTARIVIIVALLVTGVLVLANGFADSDTAVAGSSDGGGGATTTSPSASASAAPSTAQSPQQQQQPEAPKADKPGDTFIAVFNGTDSTGLAGIVADELVNDGYVPGQEPADAPNKPVTDTIVYFVGGPAADQNRADAERLAEKYYPDAKVKELDPAYTDNDLVDKSVQVVVVVGQSDDTTA
jgi:hypothetical protein